MSPPCAHSHQLLLLPPQAHLASRISHSPVHCYLHSHRQCHRRRYRCRLRQPSPLPRIRFSSAHLRSQPTLVVVFQELQNRKAHKMPARTRASTKRTNSGSSSLTGSVSGSAAKPLSFGGEKNASITSFLKPQTQNQRSLSVKSTVVEDDSFNSRHLPISSGSSGGSVSQPPKPSKGKSRDGDIDTMWSEAYAPSNIDQLAVHSRKVGDVRHWLAEATSDTRVSKYRVRLVIAEVNGSNPSCRKYSFSPVQPDVASRRLSSF